MFTLGITTHRMKILVSKFDNDSRDQFMKTDKTVMGSEFNMHCLSENDIVLGFNYKSNELFGIGRIGLFENNQIIRENPISNVQGIYDGEYSKYSKYEIAIKNFCPYKMNIDKLVKILKIEPKTKNNFMKNSNTRSFTPIYYKSSNEDDNKRIIDTFTLIIETALENLELNNKILNDKISILEKELKIANAIQ